VTITKATLAENLVRDVRLVDCIATDAVFKQDPFKDHAMLADRTCLWGCSFQ